MIAERCYEARILLRLWYRSQEDSDYLIKGVTTDWVFHSILVGWSWGNPGISNARICLSSSWTGTAQYPSFKSNLANAPISGRDS